MAAHPASAPPPFSSPRRWARTLSRPPGRRRNATPAASSAAMSRSITRRQDFVAVTKDATQGRGADVILDIVGGDYVARNYEAAAVEGRIVQIAFLASSRVNVDLMRLMLKRLTHTGSTLRARAVADKGAIARAVEANVLPLIAADLRLPRRAPPTPVWRAVSTLAKLC